MTPTGNAITESELFAAYQRVKAKAATGEFNFMRLQDLVQEVEKEQFENHAGYLNNFGPWHEMKSILGLLTDTDGR